MTDNDGERLRPATRDELMDSLAYAMRYRNGRRVRDDHAEGFMSRLAAECLAEHLELSGFVVMKKPPARAHSTSHMPLPSSG